MFFLGRYFACMRYYRIRIASLFKIVTISHKAILSIHVVHSHFILKHYFVASHRQIFPTLFSHEYR